MCYLPALALKHVLMAGSDLMNWSVSCSCTQDQTHIPVPSLFLLLFLSFLLLALCVSVSLLLSLSLCICLSSCLFPCLSLCLVKANRKPHDFMISMEGSVTRDQSGWRFIVKQGGKTVHEDSGACRVITSNMTVEEEVVTLASLPSWLTDYSSHHSHQLNRPAAESVVWDELPQLAHQTAQS